MAARNPSAFAADPVSVNQAAPSSSVLSAHHVHQATPTSAGIDGAPDLALPTKKVASTNSRMTLPPPPPPPPQAPTTEMVPLQCPSYTTAPRTEGASMKMVPRQGASMAEPTPSQFPSVAHPVMQGANTVWPMPLQKPWRSEGGPVLAPLPFPAPAASAGIVGAPLALPTKNVASTSSCMTVPPPPPPPPPQAPTTEPPKEGASMKMAPRQGASMAEPTPPQFPSVAQPVMQGSSTVWPMPLQKPWPRQGGPVSAPLPFPAHLPLMMVPPCTTALQPPQPMLPAGPPPLKRQRADYVDMPFGPQMSGCEHKMARFDETSGLPCGPYINEMPSAGSCEPSLPSDASNTLHIEGLPSNCTRRELAHIFRPFAGYIRVRLASRGYNNRHAQVMLNLELLPKPFLPWSLYKVTILTCITNTRSN